MGAALVSGATADALRKWLARRDPRPVQPSPRPPVGRYQLFVRCTSATPAGGGGVGDECYPAVVVDPDSSELVADQPELGDVWLTLIDAGAAAVPDAGSIYPVLLAGEFDPGSDSRLRCFSVAAASSGGGGSLTSGETTYSTEYLITTDDTWEDTGFDLSLPSAGTYLVVARINCNANVSARVATASRIYARLYNETDATPFDDAVMVGADASVIDYPHSNTLLIHRVLTVGGAKTMRVEGRRSGSSTWTESGIGGSGFGADWTVLSYIKIA